MVKKRKSVASSLDDVDRTMYSTFCSAANSLSHLYTQAMNHQKLSFHAGERHALEKLYQWILRQQEGGSRVNTLDILNYLQNEMAYGGEDSSISSRTPHQGQHSQLTPHMANTGLMVPPSPSGAQIPTQGFRTEQQDSQPRNPVFSNALSSPVRRSLQNYHIAQGSHYPVSSQNCPNQNRDTNFNDSSMDMNDETPDNESTH